MRLGAAHLGLIFSGSCPSSRPSQARLSVRPRQEIIQYREINGPTPITPDIVTLDSQAMSRRQRQQVQAERRSPASRVGGFTHSMAPWSSRGFISGPSSGVARRHKPLLQGRISQGSPPIVPEPLRAWCTAIVACKTWILVAPRPNGRRPHVQEPLDRRPRPESNMKHGKCGSRPH